MSSLAQPAYPAAVPLTVVGPLRNSLLLAARSVENPDLVTAQILQEIPILNTQRFTFDYPVGEPWARPTTYQLAVRSVNPAGVLERYLLVPPTDDAILWPTYAGQTIYPSAVLELWSVPGQTPAAVLSPITLTINTYNRPAEYMWLAGSVPTASQTTV
jgi:hypothetical protein